MRITKTSGALPLQSELHYFLNEYPPGSKCWFYEAHEEGSAKRGTINGWEILDGENVAARMTSGELIPVIHIIFDRIAN
jgi:hypothetical protein